MKKLNITKEAFNKSKYFTSKYGKLEYVSESGKVYKTNKGKLLMFNEAEGDNEYSVAKFLFQCLKESNPNSTGVWIRSLEDAVDFDGEKVEVKDASIDKGGMYNPKKVMPSIEKQYAISMAKKKNLHYRDDGSTPIDMDRNRGKSKRRMIKEIIESMNYDYGVVQLGNLGLPGDIAVVSGDKISVVEVKSNSLGRRMFNPTFEFVDGILVPKKGTRYANNDKSTLWTDEVLSDINIAIQDNGGDPNVSWIPLNCDFSDFVKNYSTRNPFGTIEYVALGYGDTGITFYKVVENPEMDIYGTGKANRLAERRANSIHDEFNSAYLSLRTRDDR